MSQPTDTHAMLLIRLERLRAAQTTLDDAMRLTDRAARAAGAGNCPPTTGAGFVKAHNALDHAAEALAGDIHSLLQQLNGDADSQCPGTNPLDI